MNVAITGSRGLIGSHLKERLEKDGHTIIEWDLKNNNDIKAFVIGSADYVIHLAAYADVRASLKDPERYWVNNVENTTKIQKLCDIHNIPLLYASSSCVHKWWLSPYGTSKKVNEETARAGQVGLRFTTVYGKGARNTMLVSRLIDGNIEYVTNHTRDFIHARDVADAIAFLMSKDVHSLDPVYDIGTGHGVLVTDLAKIAGFDDLPVSVGEACEALDNTANIDKIKALGWSGPSIDVKMYVHANTLGGIPV